MTKPPDELFTLVNRLGLILLKTEQTEQPWVKVGGYMKELCIEAAGYLVEVADFLKVENIGVNVKDTIEAIKTLENNPHDAGAIRTLEYANKILASKVESYEYPPPPVQAAPGNGEQAPSVKPRGVSMLDAALFYQDGDLNLAREQVDRWQKSRRPKPEWIGSKPGHKQIKLATPRAMLTYVKSVEAMLPSSMTDAVFLKTLEAKAVEPEPL